MSPTRGVALILAAGASSRLGGEPKSLLPVGPERAVERLVRVARESGWEPTVVVGAHADRVEPVARTAGARVARNDGWALGRTSSVHAGLLAVGTDRPVLLWPVDHPFVQAKTIFHLANAAERDAMGVWFIPTFEDRGGHPVLLAPPGLGRVMALGPEEPLRHLLPELGPQVVRLPVDDPGVLRNVDTWEEYRAGLAEWAERGD